MRELTFAVIVALSLLFMPAANAQIDVNEVNQPYTLIEARCQCTVPEGASPVYFWSASQRVDYVAVDDGVRLIMTAPPGQHSVTIQAIFVNWESEQITQQSYSRTFSVEGDDRPDPPDPPDPQPDGTAEKLVIVRESGEQTPAQDALFRRLRRDGAGSVQPSSPQNPTVYIFDPNDQSSTAQAWARRAGSPLPWLFVVREDKTLMRSVRLPERYEDVVALCH